jgi:hypothetical protein
MLISLKKKITLQVDTKLTLTPKQEGRKYTKLVADHRAKT